MTYCLGIITKYGLVMASDSRSNAGNDQVNVCRKMHMFEHPGQRVLVLLSAGSLSCTQSIITLLRRDFDQGKGLAAVTNMYDAARIVGQQIRAITELDRPALERDHLSCAVSILMGGQILGETPRLFLIYPQGNPLEALAETPYLQLGEVKYGRPILDRGIRYDVTTLEDSAKYALLSLDSTMRSNVTVGPPIDLVAYNADALRITHQRRFGADDSDLQKIRTRWDQALRQAVQRLPAIRFRVLPEKTTTPSAEESIELVDASSSDPLVEQYSQRQSK
jgi:putative proteasome-type protease